MPSYTNEVLREIAYAFRKYREYRPEAGEKFQEFLEASLKSSVLDSKTKELILVGIAVALRCEPCIVLHIKKALEVGAKPEEIADSISLAILMGGGPVATSSGKAFKALEELVKKKEKKQS